MTSTSYTAKALIRHHSEDTGRTLDVTPQWEEANPGVAKHWVKGGEVEVKNEHSGWIVARSKYMQDMIDCSEYWEFRIKQREPQPGEVWINDNTPALITSKGFVWLTNNNYMECDFLTHVPCAEYAAPSVTAYYARELYEAACDNGEGEMQALHDLCREACQFED